MPSNYTIPPEVTSNYNTRPWISFIMTELLDFLMTEDDNYLITDDSVYSNYGVKTIINSSYNVRTPI